MRTFLVFLALLVGVAVLPGAAEAQRRVLVYGPGGTTSTSYFPTTGTDRAVITVASDAMWRSLSATDFQSYNAIWIDGANCASGIANESIYAAATATRLTWSSVITGHFEIIGSDEDFHSSNPGAQKFIRNSYEYVTSGAGTGLFVSTGCVYYQAPAGTPVPWLQGIGDFRVTGDSCTDGQLLEPGAGTHPLVVGVSPPTTTINLPGDLSWGCFTHSHFDHHPPSFQRIFSIHMVGPGEGVVIVNDRGGCVVDADCIAGQFCNRDAAGGQPTCRVTLGNGRPCTTGVQCTSGICTEGVCCNATCSGTCESCRNAGSIGLCIATVGTPVLPRTPCTGLGTTCGGRCDGTHRATCTFPGMDTTCSAATCSGGHATLASMCDGVGNCPPGAMADCGMYACGPAGCLTTCTSDADCSPGAACHAGACVVRRPPGSMCTTDADCATGHCADGVCCDTACNGQCEACDVPGSAGTCTAVTGTPHGSRSTCAGAGAGSTCGGTCNGTRRAACSYPDSSVVCSAPSCAMGTAILASYCDGMGACPPARTLPCGTLSCGPTACLTMCAMDTDCMAGYACVMGACAPLQPPGSACTRAGQCASGHCVDGVCCDTACNGQCEACDTATAVGTCTAVTGNPHGHRTTCTGAGTGTCGGTCNGTRRDTCGYPGSDVTCRAASCSAGTAATAASCDGMGACGGAPTTPCGAYACDGVACRRTCTQPAHCAPGNYCNELGQCVAVPAGARGCATDADCMGGACAAGICCDRQCNGPCESCRLPGSIGTCAPLSRGTVPPAPGDGGAPTCTACDGNRGCVGATDGGGVTDGGAAVDAGLDGGAGTGTGAGAAAHAGCGCHTTSRTGGGVPVTALLALGAVLASRRRRR